MTTVARFEINSMQPHIGSKWRWFIALGVVLVIVGALAFFNLPAATTASVYLIGIFMFIGALAQLGTAFAVLSWSGFCPAAAERHPVRSRGGACDSQSHAGRRCADADARFRADVL
ncbi:MAG TPA: DUF308 domain-containing protein, partial [Casimicrobiaceae bacterium]|nr:DUF308 domain-containing protein [Casimicrobiaceae bacterium]